MAGPIVRAANLLPQLAEHAAADRGQRWDGLRLILYGLLQEDRAGRQPRARRQRGLRRATPFADPRLLVGRDRLFAFQIYCDFSGYSDIARGLAKWMGFEFTLNFDHPYCRRQSASSGRAGTSRCPRGSGTTSTSRWAASRKGAAGPHTNMWITMLISGLWHGAAWTFVLWGALHACFLSLERALKWPSRLAGIPGAGRVVLHALLLCQVLLAWVFFRAASFSQAVSITREMFGLRHPGLSSVSLLGGSRAVLPGARHCLRSGALLRAPMRVDSGEIAQLPKGPGPRCAGPPRRRLHLPAGARAARSSTSSSEEAAMLKDRTILTALLTAMVVLLGAFARAGV